MDVSSVLLEFTEEPAGLFYNIKPFGILCFMYTFYLYLMFCISFYIDAF